MFSQNSRDVEFNLFHLCSSCHVLLVIDILNAFNVFLYPSISFSFWHPFGKKCSAYPEVSLALVSSQEEETKVSEQFSHKGTYNYLF